MSSSSCERQRVKRLYFDIDGTLLELDTGQPKPDLALGRFERAVREAGFEEVVCVGNFVGIIREVWTFRPEYDGLGAILALCGGVFVDETWFRRTVSLVRQPRERAAEVIASGDWWYVDDEAQKYFVQAGRERLFRENLGGRIFVPRPSGSGADILTWMEGVSESP